MSASPPQNFHSEPPGLASPIPDESTVLEALDRCIVEARLLRRQLALCRQRQRQARLLGNASAPSVEARGD